MSRDRGREMKDIKSRTAYGEGKLTCETKATALPQLRSPGSGVGLGVRGRWQ